MKCNFNDQATVTLTEFGAWYYTRHLAQFPPICRKVYRTGEKVRMPLWEIAQIFGSLLFNGAPQTPFLENTLEIECPRN